jgi:succinoglycan biosynthesis transport protein ExoP
LMREADNAQRSYDAAMGRMTQTKLESQTTQTNIAVINEAVEPIEPSSPKLMLNTLVALFIGALLATCFAVLRELSNRVVRSAVDVTDLVGVPVLGVLRHQRRGWRMIGTRRHSVPQLT